MIVAIDPGATGAIAWLSDAGDLLAIEDMPSMEILVGGKKRTRVSAAGLADLIGSIGDRRPRSAFVEKVGAMPGQGTASMFSFGYSAGLAEGVLAGLGVPVEFLTPQAWKKNIGLADKAAARMRAGQQWPEMAKLFARKKDEGRAEAALMGLAGIRLRGIR